MIRETRVYDIFSLRYRCLYKYSEGIVNLKLFFTASPLFISYVPIWKRIFKTEGGFFKYLDTVNINFIYSEPPDEQFSHITLSKNESLKYFFNITSKKTVSFFSVVHFGWSIYLGELEVGNPSRYIISLSEINSTYVFNLEHLWHFLFSISTMLKN